MTEKPTINVKELKVHPQNKEIYGEEDIEELADKIKESGWIRPLVIKADGTVISGHRRLKACLLLGIKEVEYERVSFNNENEEIERLLAENQSREKTAYQKLQEAKFWEEVVKEKARLRKLSTLNNQTVDVEKFPPRENEIGKTRDIIAARVGLGSGKTYMEAKKIVNEIDKLKEEGKEKDSEFLKTVLNDGGVNSAKNLLKTDLSKVDEGLKEKVINKEISAKEAVKEIKKEIEVEKVKVNETVDKDTCPTRENEISSINEEIKVPQENIIENNEEETISILDNIILGFEADKNSFMKSMSKYLEMEEQLSELEKVDKAKVREYIEEVKRIFNKIEDMMF